MQSQRRQSGIAHHATTPAPPEAHAGAAAETDPAAATGEQDPDTHPATRDEPSAGDEPAEPPYMSAEWEEPNDPPAR